MSPDHILKADIKQGGPDAKTCPVNPAHGRLTVMGNGLALGCFNRVKEDEARQIAEAGRPVFKLEASKVLVCGHTESFVG